ncbi:MFS transporter [Nocardia macrotermitis]|uniref:Putative multidrug resistance protein MdtD n=1 Tax=Nocardia macrotermitis TaxID=2585198 RepID=A0A7K0D0B8_9NOCA|nr:MFS transporter [Nocardia macrotermitis]MQY19175.1 putative multidrug resistance protein MdtD [Nocardia macrotermitis]
MTDTDVDSGPLRGRARWFALGALALAAGTLVFDATIVGVSMPAVIAGTGLGFSAAQWVLCAYSVVFAALLITAGRVGDRVGMRTLMAIGVVLVVAGSLLAAAAHHPDLLIWGRIVQGAGAACVPAGVFSAIDAVFRGRDRTLAYTAGGVALGVVAVLGALLGGWLTTSFTWPWIFLVNVPIGAILLAGILVVVPEVRTEDRGLDIDGFLLGAAGFAVVVFALIEGAAYGWGRPLRAFPVFGLHWSVRAAASPAPVLLVLGIVLLVLFLLWEHHRAQSDRPALLDLSLFTKPAFRWGAAAAFASALTVFGLLFVLPLYLVDVLDLSTLHSGLIVAVAALGALLGGLVARGPVAELGRVRIVRLGLAIQTVTIALTALCITADISPWWVAVLLLCYGLGLGVTCAHLTAITLSGTPRERSYRRGRAAQTTLAGFGASLGVAILGGALSLSLGHALTDRLAAIHDLPHRTAREVTIVTHDSAGGAIAALRAHHADPAVVEALARGFTDATRAALLVAAVILLLGFCAATRIPPGVVRTLRAQAVSDAAPEAKEAADEVSTPDRTDASED